MTIGDSKKVEVERHIQTVGIGLITIALAWGSSTMRQIYDAQLEQSLAIESIKASMVDLKADIKDVRGQLASVPTNREVDARFEHLNSRVIQLERGRLQ